MAKKVVDGRSSVAKAVKTEVYDSLREALTKPQGKSKKSYAQDFIEIMLKEAKRNPSGAIGQILAKQLLMDDILSKLDSETDKFLARDRDFIRFRIMNTLYKEQRDVFLDSYRKKIVIGSRRIGKTELAARLLLEDMIYIDHHAVFISMKFENGIKQCYPIVLDLAKSLGMEIERESKSDGEILFVNGSSILFKGNNNKSEADKLLGYKFSTAIIDEAQNQTNLMYLLDTVLTPAMTDYIDSKVLLIGTPPRIPHTAVERIWKEYHEWHHYSWDMTKNPFLHNVKEYIEEICRSKGITEEAAFIQREMYGQWVWDKEAQVYKGYKTYNKDNPPEFPIDHVYIGNDYGWSAYNGIVGVACNTQMKKGYVFFEEKFNKATVTDIVCSNKRAMEAGKKLLIKWNAPLDNIGIYGDTSDTTILEEMKRVYGLPAMQAWKYNKEEAITQLADHCRNGQILIPENGLVADEFDQIVFKRDEDDNITNEIDDELFHGDISMALLYASRQWCYHWGLPTGHEEKKEPTTAKEFVQQYETFEDNRTPTGLLELGDTETARHFVR